MTAAPVLPVAPAKWHDRFPELGTDPVPIEPYISAEYFEAERERIFRRAWLNVGRIEQVPRTGDYFVKALEIGRTSLIVVRAGDGQVRAFHNVCSHRANKLLKADRGRCQAISCSFHGWSYGLDGRLRGVPDEGGFFNLDKSTLGLTPVATEIWNGFIFVNLSPEPRQTAAEYLGVLGEELGDFPFEQLSQTCYSWQTEVAANWKLVKDAFQETYHVAFLHRRSLPDSFTSKANPFSHNSDYRLEGPHHRASMYLNRDRQPSRVEALARQFSGTFIGGGGKAGYLPPSFKSRGKNWGGDINVFFPNMFLDTGGALYLTYHMWPLAVDRTRWEVRVYFPRARNAGERFAQEYSKVLFRDAILEDASTVEETQSVLSSGAKTHFVLQDAELLIRHDSHTVDRWVRGEAGNV